MPRPALTESAFRRYENILAYAAAQGGATFDAKTLAISVSTAVARLRDAIRSFRHFGWSASFTKDQIAGFLVSHEEGETFYVGPQRPSVPSVLNATQVAAAPQIRATGALTMVMPDATPEALEAYAILANLSLKGLPALSVPRNAANGHLAETLASLEQVYDIAVTPKPHEWFII